MSDRRSLLVVASISILLAFGCRQGITRPEVKPADPLWNQYISMHTSGIVSRKAKISVRFTEDLFDKEQVGQDARAFLVLEPEVKGACVIADPREIVLVPEADLTPGAFYKGRFVAKGLSSLPKKIGDFEFLFQVIQRAIDLQVEGLITSQDSMTLNGVLATSDVESGEDVEKVLTPKLPGSNLTTLWTHEGDSRRHTFAITGIQRSADTQTLILDWDGSAVGISGKGEQKLEVPGLDTFKVMEIKPVQGEPRYVALHFSDELDPKQNLKGLITSNLRSFSLRVEGSVLKLFPDSPTAGKITVKVERGVRNKRGATLAERREETVGFASEKPQVRFTGQGTILPDNDVLSIPIEAMNVNAIQVTAFQIFEQNVGQFLQSNKLEGRSELGRVGRNMWRKTIPLTSPVPDQWQRYHLDVTSLLKKAPGGIFRLTVSINRGNSIFACTEQESAVPVKQETDPRDQEDADWRDASGWDGIQDFYYDGENNNWQDRQDPCKDAYYAFAENIRDSRNLLASNIGLVAKADATGRITLVATDLRSAAPLSGVAVSFRNFQGQEIARGATDVQGFLQVQPAGPVFYALAEKDGQKGYLKMSDGTALSMSHFDTGGEKIPDGIKGFVYGERGVWRPGDEIHLTFVLEDKNDLIPSDHPATFKLYNPQGQLVRTQTNSRPVGDFYRFDAVTDENAPTGAWNAEVLLGNSVFRRPVKIEAVMPNRLKIDLDLGGDLIRGPGIAGTIFSQWLHGASANGLKADIEVTLSAGVTRFDRFQDYLFSDPTRALRAESRRIFEGRLDSQGRAAFDENVPIEDAPGFLTAGFKARVFEEGGAFSVAHKSVPFSPYTRYVGLKLPKGDQGRNMLLTDQTHPVSIAALDAKGLPAANTRVHVTFHKAAWRWWWDQSNPNADAEPSGSWTNSLLSQGVVTTDKEGRAQWEFMVKYPDWGRYLVRACEADGGHCAAQYVYIDWPGWAGRAQEQSGPGANALYFFSDKASYLVGEKAVIQLPDASQGRGLLTVENGSRVLEHRWIEFSKGKTKFDLPITRDMAPNVYAAITLVQPHQNKENDRPIRLYGVLSLKVTDPATILTPVLEAPDEWAPRRTVSVKVSEAKGRPLTYTLAVVDEGLLGLTSYDTPDLHGHFYKKEALGVKTWDLFDDVVGAYGATLERLLAIGGSDDIAQEDRKSEERRFPPVVRVMGPFRLEKGGIQTQSFDLPQYVGQVRVMVVAGERGAYGKTEKNVFVREPVSVLPTLPRVLGPEEEITVPVSVFSTDPAVKEVSLSLETDDRFQVIGNRTVRQRFEQPGDAIVFFKAKAGDRVGPGLLTVIAKGGPHETRADTHLTVRPANPATIEARGTFLEPGKEWSLDVKPHGLAGTNQIVLEASALPPLNLEKRLQFLIQYPHGCVEQTTSSVFPQLYLPGLVQLAEAQKGEVEKNVISGIDRLRNFQAANGGFYYWPGAFNGVPNDWATNYVGHFLLEAERLGYGVPADMKAGWVKYQKDRAQSWSAQGRSDILEQAYRLYTLALARQPALGAMNRLRESAGLPGTAAVLLAAAYQTAGVAETASDLARNAKTEDPSYTLEDPTFGTSLRDKAIYLVSLAQMKQYENGKDLAQEISDKLSGEKWLGTQETSYALMAMSRYYDTGTGGKSWRFDWSVGDLPAQSVSPEKPIFSQTLPNFPETGTKIKVVNRGDKRIFASIIARGVPRAGEETAASSGLELRVSYSGLDGNPLGVERMNQGTDFLASVSIKNKTPGAIHNVAVTHIVASGWEIQSPPWGTTGAVTPGVSYRDVRDDRVLSYLDLPAGATVTWEEKFHASYQGRYYLPGTAAEAMYDASKNSRTTGQWVEVAR